MRLHIQNPAGDPAFPFTAAQWDAAVARSPDMATVDLSIGGTPGELGRALREAEVVLTWVDIVGEQLRRSDLRTIAPKLRVLSCNSAGVDRLSPFDWLPADIALLNNSGSHADKAGEFGLMALLMLQNHMPELIAAQQRRSWTRLHATTLRGRRLCVVGMGSLGGGVARRARALGVYVIGVRHGSEPHPDCDETFPADALDTLLPRVDDLVLACPLTESTRNLLSRERIARMRSGARVVNIARGAVWDQDAVCDALEAGHLQSAFTDVTVPEPLPASHRMWGVRGLILTPHIAADDRERYNDVTLDILFENLRAMREGRPLPNRIDSAKGY